MRKKHCYPLAYKGFKSLPEMLTYYEKEFGVDIEGARKYMRSISKAKLPDGAEGWIAAPTVGALARIYFSSTKDEYEQYCEVINFVHTKIFYSRKGLFYPRHPVNSMHLLMRSRAKAALNELQMEQKGSDIIIFPAQFGKRYTEVSVEDTVSGFFRTDEFAFGSYLNALMLLIHPERLSSPSPGQINLVCAGDKIDLDGHNKFERVPVYRYEHNDPTLVYGTIERNTAKDSRGIHGIATGFYRWKLK
jgi:hypothetical protein